MNRLIEIGFQQAGFWLMRDGRVDYELSRLAAQRNILYAFVCDGEVMYIGKTVSPLASRMSGYRNPSATQTTNVRNRTRIVEVLAAGGAVDIYALPDNGLLHYGRFHVNLAAGLEDDLIRVIDPAWNGGRKEIAVPLDVITPATSPTEDEDLQVVAGPHHNPRFAGAASVELANHSRDTLGSVAMYGPRAGPTAQFTFVLQPTYRRTGFFNVSVLAQALLGGNGETIELYVDQSEEPLLGKINRTANQNGTPRIMGGTALRDWFQAVAEVMDVMHVDVLSPNAIRLRPHG